MRKKLNPKDWLYWGQWIQPLLHGEVWMYWGKSKILRRAGIRVESNLFLANGHFFWWNRDYLIVFKKAVQAIKKQNWKFFISIERASEEATQAMLSIESMVLHKNNNFGLINCFINTLIELIGPWTSIFVVSDALEKELNNIISRYNIDFSQCAALIHPDKKSLIMQQHDEMINILEMLKRSKSSHILKLPYIRAIKKLCKENPRIFKIIQNHVKKYAWIGTHHFWGTGLTVRGLLKSMKQELKIEKKTEKKSQDKNIRRLLPPLAKKLIHFLSLYTYWRLHLAETSDLVAFSLRPLFRQLEEKLGLDKGDIFWLTIKEVKNGLAGKKVPSKKVIKQRKKSYAILHFNNKTNVFVGKQAKRYLKTLSEKQKTIVKPANFNGTIGCRGIVCGRVGIVKTPSDINKIKEGYVLVAPETTPDFVLGMKRAAAIVTDLGGITSHAAIIAREMNKPCVIGTKIATKVLKDGDLVEVDANKGIVRILKRKEK